jgi:hypothetical protein
MIESLDWLVESRNSLSDLPTHAGLRDAYRQRGIGAQLEPPRPSAVLVVDFINGFTDPDPARPRSSVWLRKMPALSLLEGRAP